MSSNDREMTPIDINKLSLQQLTQIKKQCDQELGIFQDSLQTLKIAQTKFSDSRESLEKLTTESTGSTIMVPLTGSMFVPGTLLESDNVLVDVGTGYYLNMNLVNAKDYFKRKITFVTEQMEKIQTIGIDKSRLREVIMETMDSKIQAQMAAQKAAQNATLKT